MHVYYYRGLHDTRQMDLIKKKGAVRNDHPLPFKCFFECFRIFYDIIFVTYEKVNKICFIMKTICSKFL